LGWTEHSRSGSRNIKINENQKKKKKKRTHYRLEAGARRNLNRVREKTDRNEKSLLKKGKDAGTRGTLRYLEATWCLLS